MPRGQYICPFRISANGDPVPCDGESCKINFKTKKDTNNCSIKLIAASLMVIAKSMSDKQEIPTDNIQSDSEEEDT